MKYFYVCWLVLSAKCVLAQCLSSGALPTFVRDFGADAPTYSTRTTTDLGFSTTYQQVFGTRTGAQKDWILDGEFAIINLTTDPFYSFGNKPVWHKDITDHTGNPGGYMMAVNASIDPGEFYREEVSGLCTGVTYDFSVWLANMDVPAPARTKPNVRFEIRNAYDNTLIADYETGDIAQNSSLKWENHAVTFNANVDKLTLLLINNNPGGAGNDLLIDDIEFKPCLPVYRTIPSVSTKLCIGENLTLEAKDDGIGYFTPEFQWQRKDNSTGHWSDLSGETGSILALNNVTETDSGWYKVFVAEKGVLSSIQCRSEDSFFVAIHPRLKPGKIQSSQQICFNTSPTPLTNLIAASSKDESFFYFWEASLDSLTWSDLGNASDNYSSGPLTESTVFRRGVRSGCYTEYSDTAVIVVYEKLTGGEIEANQIVCADSLPVELKSKSAAQAGEGNYTYEWQYMNDMTSWTTIAGSNSVDFQPFVISRDTWFKRKVIDNSCGSALSNEIKLSIQLTPEPVVSDINFCQGSAFPGFSVSGTNLLWYESLTDLNGESTAPKVDSSIAGILSYFVTNTENGCESAKSEIKVAIYSTPQISISNFSICSGDSVTLTPSITGGTAPLTYLWSPASGLSSSSAQEVVASPTVTSSYKVIVKDGNNCSDSTDLTITVHSKPSISVNNLTLCSGKEGDLIASITDGTAPFIYSWSPATGLSSNTRNQVKAKPLVSTNYTVIVKDQNQCSDTALAKVTVNNNPKVSISGGDICSGSPTTLKADVINGSGTIQYLWSPASGLSNTNTSSVSANPAATTSYQVRVEDANSCVDSVIFTVGVTKGPNAEILSRDTVLCVGESYTLEAFDDPSENYSFQWLYGASPASLSPVAETNSVATIENEGYYAVEVRNHGFCQAYSNVVFVAVEEVAVKAYSSDHQIKYGDQVVLSAKSSSVNIRDWTWTTPTGEVKGETIIVHPEETFIYTVEATASKCSAKDEVKVEVLPPIIIPNGFSPNGDGKNDLWFIEGLEEYFRAELVVYNRWGEKVYENSGGYNDPWNGKSMNGGELPVATYYYLIKTNDSEGTIFNGSVTILR